MFLLETSLIAGLSIYELTSYILLLGISSGSYDNWMIRFESYFG